MTFETLPVEHEFTTLDLLLWRRFQSEAEGRVERVMNLNPHLGDHAYLPIGTRVRVPVEDPKPIAVKRVRRLWGAPDVL